MRKPLYVIGLICLSLCLALPAHAFGAANNAAPAKPAAPTLSLNGETVSIVWKAVSGAASYQVYRRDESRYDKIADTTGLSATEDVSGIYRSYDRTYQYEIVAVGSNGQKSNASSPASIRIPSNAAQTPQNIKVANVHQNVTFTWSPSANAAFYRVYRAMSGGGPYSLISDNLTATQFNDPEFPTLPGAAWTTYYYKIVAVNALGIESQPAHTNATREAPATPNKPTISLANNEVHLSWNAIPNVSKYEVMWTYVDPSNNQYTTKKAETTQPSLTLSLISFDLSKDTNVSFQVRSFDMVGNASSWYSETATAAIPKAPFVAPQNVKVQANGNNAVISWDIHPKAASYRVYRQLPGGQSVAIGTTSNNSYTDESLPNEQRTAPVQVRYAVEAINASGVVSPISESVMLTLEPNVTEPQDPGHPGDPGNAPEKPDDGYEVPPALSSGNLLSNSTFTKFKNNVADYWIRERTSSAIVNELSVYERPDQPGNTAQFIQASDIPQNSYLSIAQRVPLALGQEFRASAMVDVQELTNATVQLYIDFYEDGDKWVRAAYQEIGEVSSGYVPLKLEGIVPTRAVSAKIYVLIKGTGPSGSGTIIVDDVSFSVGNGIIVNSDFQSTDAATGLPSAWGATATNGSAYTIVTEAYSNDDERALKIGVTNLSANGIAGVFQRIPVGLAKGRYALQTNVWVSDLNEAEAQLYIEFYNGSNVLVGSNSASFNEQAEQFVPIQAEGVLPEDAVTARILLLVRGKAPDASGTAYFSDVKLSFDENRLSNADFEQTDVNGGPALWVLTASPGVANASGIASDRSRQGENALRIAATSLKSGQMAVAWQKIPVAADDSFEYSGHLLVESLSGSKAQLYIDFLDANQNVVKYASMDITATSSEYAKYTLTGIVPAGAKYAKAYLILRGMQDGGEGSFLVDDLSFQTSRNRLVESKFETVGAYPGIAYGWGTSVASGVTAGFDVVSTGDGKAQQLVATNLPTNAIAAIYQKVPLTRSGYFYSSVQLHTVMLSNSIVQLYVDFYDASNKIIGAKSADLNEMSDGFQSLSISGTVPVGTAYAKLYVILRATGADGAGVVLIDNAKFEIY